MRNKLKITNEQMMNARALKLQGNLPGAAYVIAAADGNVLAMRILSEIQDQTDNNNGELPSALYETLRIIVCTLLARMENQTVAKWVLGDYNA